MEGSLTLKNDAVATGNTAKTVTISGANVKFIDNTVTGNVAVSTANNVIANNTIGGTITGTPSTTSIVNNTIITDNTYTMQFTRLTNSNITDNYLIAGTNAGERTISVSTNTDSVIENNLPEVMEDLIITDDTYSQFFTEGIFTYTVTDYATIILNGPFYNKDFIFADNILNIKGNNATIYNGTMELKDNVKATVDDIAFVNEDDEKENVIIVSTPNNTIQRIKINQTRSTKGNAQPIYVTSSGNKIINNEIILSSVASDIRFGSAPSIAPVAAIVVLDSDNNVSNNVITVTITSVDGSYPSSEAITVQGSESSPAENNIVNRNTITVNGLIGYQYGINVGSFANGNEISNNNIQVTSTAYSNGIQVSTPIATDNKITSNTINVTSTGENGMVYGVILNNWGSNTTNTIINSNTIYGQADSVYLIEYAVIGGQGSDSTVNSNKLYGTGNYTIGIGISAIGVTANSNTIEITGTTNATVESYDAIKPTTAGIILQNTNDSTIKSNTITANGGPAIKLISESENNAITLNKLVSDNVAIYVVNSNNNEIKNQTINNLNVYTVAVENATGNVITDNYLNGSDYYGGDESVELINSEDNTVENNRPSIIVITDDNYSTYFDENGTFIVENPNFVTIGSDLNNKDLIFTTGVNITNLDDYTINNGTIVLNIDSIANTRNMYINNINFDNTDKEAYIINVNDSESAGQINIYINGGDIKVTGEDVTAIDVPLNVTHVYLDVENTNIAVDGEKATAVNYVGKIKEGYLEFAYNNVTVTGKESAIAINLTSSDTEIYDNNFIINSNGTARALIANNSRIRYSDGFSNNNITGTAPDINAITYMNKPTTDSSSNYIRYNNINLTSDNPITAIDIENVHSIIVQYNNITANAVNNETPVILLSNVTGSKRSYGDQYSYFNVRYNYILAEDVYGDDAIEATEDSTIIVENNYPNNAEIEIISDLAGKRTDVINITAVVKNDKGTTVTSGNVTFTIGNETISTEITDGVATVEYTIPAGANNTNVTVIFEGTHDYAKTETTDELEVIVYKADVTVLTSKESYKPQDTITLTAVVSEDGVLLNSGKVIFKLNGITLKENSTAIIANVQNGFATVTYTLPGLSRDQYNITAVYSNPYYERAEGYNVLNIVKSNTQIRATATTDGTLTTITGTILDSDNNLVSGVTKVTIKINGLTYVKEVNVTNGVIDETFDTSTLTLDKFYNLTIIAGETKLYQSSIYNTVFSISSANITKVETEVVITSVVDENNQTNVIGTIVDADGNAVKGTSKVTVKANGITVLNRESITDGKIDLSFDSSKLTGSEYALTIIYEGSSVYNSSQGNSTLIRV